MPVVLEKLLVCKSKIGGRGDGGEEETRAVLRGLFRRVTTTLIHNKMCSRATQAFSHVPLHYATAARALAIVVHRQRRIPLYTHRIENAFVAEQ